MRSPLLIPNPIASDLGLLILRIVSGGVMLTHGYSKFQKMMAGNMQFGDPLGIGQASSILIHFRRVCLLHSYRIGIVYPFGDHSPDH